MTSPKNDIRGYGGVLEQPEGVRSVAGRRRRRRRMILGALTLVVLAGIVGVAAARSGLLPGRDTAESKESTTTVAAVEATAVAEPAAAAEATAAPGTSAALAATEIEIGWVGDLTPGSKYGNPPSDGRALFEYTRDYTMAPDVMVANLEGTFGNGGPSKCDGRDSSACYAFQAPPANAAALSWAGFDVVNMANNHSNDYFGAGMTATKEALSANGVDYTGLVDSVALKEIEGVTVAFLGFSPYSWSPSIGDLEAAQALVRETDEVADVIVVLMHAGAEGVDKTHVPEGAETAYGEFRGDSRAFSHAVIDAGADAVFGSGPHVVRGMEEYGGRIVAYSLGNFAGWKNFNRSGDLALSGLLTVRFAGDGRVLGGEWLSLRIADPGVPKPDASGESAALVRQLSAEDFETPVTLGPDGTFSIDPE